MSILQDGGISMFLSIIPIKPQSIPPLTSLVSNVPHYEVKEHRVQSSWLRDYCASSHAGLRSLDISKWWRTVTLGISLGRMVPTREDIGIVLRNLHIGVN